MLNNLLVKIFYQHQVQRLRFFITLLTVSLLGTVIYPVVAQSSNQAAGPIYIVQQGDSLNEIAIRFGLSAEEIQTANEIDDPNSLFIGQNLLIPGLEGVTGILTSEVLPLGMSLNKLSRQYQVDLSDLVTLNRLTSPSEIIAGVSFILPINEKKSQQPITTPPPGASALETAIRTGTSPWVLVESNQLLSTWDLLPGETIFINQELGPNDSSMATLIDISINQLPIVQGETLHIKISTLMPMEISGGFNGETLRFLSENDNEYHSFHGIHALAEPGVYSLEIRAQSTDGTLLNFDQLVLLASGLYGNEWVRIDDTTYLDEEKIANEDAYLQPFMEQITTTRHWEGQFQFPVDEPCLSSPFGLRRNYNDGLLFYYHTGLDFRVCAQNLNIYAPAAGVIILAEEMFTLGKAVYIDHGWGVISGYAHLEEILVEVGDFVQPRELIGIIGDTGRSAGPHLHFELVISGTPVNPLTWLNQSFP
jgi:murein DD-endopeptidase MepM/ murein hydrolase activator NlpD